MLIIVYLILSIYFGRKNPLFFLILPYALQQGPGAFIDQTLAIAGKNLFSVYDNFFKDILFVITTLIGIFLIKAKLPSVNYLGFKLIYGYLFYIFFLFAVSVFSNSDIEEVFLSSRQLFFLPLSFFLWLSIFHAVSRKQYEQFLKMMFYVTPVSAVLFILNSSGSFSIFDKQMLYQEIEGESSSFFRDFATIPNQLTPVFIISILSLMVPTIKVPKWLIYANLLILPVAILFTFTRSRLISNLIQISILLILYSFYNRGRMLQKVLILLMALGILFIPTYFIAQKLYPDAVNYFTERLTDAAVEKGNEQNIDIRAEYLNKAIEITNETNSVIGAGLNRKYYPQLDLIGAWIADSTIPFLLYHTGWLGVTYIYLIMLFFCVDGFIFFKKNNNWLTAFLLSIFISLTISSLLMGGGTFTGSLWTFMYLALYTTIRFDLWKEHTNLDEQVPGRSFTSSTLILHK